jgi:hypothetical protein
MATNFDIPALSARYSSLMTEFTNHFKERIHRIDYSRDEFGQGIKMHRIRTLADLTTVKGTGLYLIATDMPVGENMCQLKVGALALPVIYRGHSYHMRDRIRSHLFNASHRAAMNPNKPYNVCIRLDDRNIEVSERPFCDHQWVVVTHSLRKSNLAIRECAERAFDAIHGRPIASREATRSGSRER